MSIPLEDRFWPKVDRCAPEDCWEWQASLTPKGYGQIARGRGRSPAAAHRVAWELTNGPIPGGQVLCHKCDNTKCCNPNHLFIGTQKDNMADAARKGRISRAHQLKGEDHNQAKLTEDDVRAIRASDKSQKELAREYGVAKGTISFIVNRQTWKHVV